MMGYKARRFGPIGNLTLEELVPEDHFYRHLEKSLDLSFVRELVRSRYAALGRPSEALQYSNSGGKERG
jgi:hypothetical protein